jgi:hypothetical protein
MAVAHGLVSTWFGLLTLSFGSGGRRAALTAVDEAPFGAIFTIRKCVGSNVDRVSAQELQAGGIRRVYCLGVVGLELFGGRLGIRHAFAVVRHAPCSGIGPR